MNEQYHKQNPGSDAIEIAVAKDKIDDPVAREKLDEIGTSPNRLIGLEKHNIILEWKEEKNGKITEHANRTKEKASHRERLSDD